MIPERTVEVMIEVLTKSNCDVTLYIENGKRMVQVSMEDAARNPAMFKCGALPDSPTNPEWLTLLEDAVEVATIIALSDTTDPHKLAAELSRDKTTTTQ